VPSPYAQTGRNLAGVAFLASVYFLAAAIATHLVSPHYNVFRDYISDYAVGPSGWIFGTAFIASCIASFAIVAALLLMAPRQALSIAALTLLLIGGLASLLDYFYPTDILPPGAPPATEAGKIHLYGALVGWIAFVVAAPLLSSKLGRKAIWPDWQGMLAFLAWLSIPLLLILIGVVVAKAPYGGLAEKVFVLDRNLWMILLTGLAFWRSAPLSR